MKKVFICFCMFFATTSLYAQVTWNAKGGLGVATCYGSDIKGSKTHFVGKVGAGIEYPLSSNLSLMPSLELAWKGAKIEDGTFKSTLDFFYLQVPAVFAYRFNLSDSWNTTLKVGPYFGYAFSNHYELSGTSGNNSYTGSGSTDINKFDVGLDAGVDFEYHRFVFGLEAEMGFINLQKDKNIKNLAFYATIGWKF